MKLLHQLAFHALEAHPDQAAVVLERLDEEEIVRLLDSDDLSGAAAIVERLSPHLGSAVLYGLGPRRAAGILDALATDSAARLIRRLDEEKQESILSLVEPRRARSLRAILRFREGTAGALMDPDVLTLPLGLDAREALQRVRKHPELTRYNLYVIDSTQRLVGAVNLRELLLAAHDKPISELMTRNPHRVRASTDRASLISHPGWRDVHALPVVDDADAFLGVVRYRVLRRLEEELAASRSGDVEAAAAFGQVIAAGARGLLDAVTGAQESGSGRRAHADRERG